MKAANKDLFSDAISGRSTASSSWQFAINGGRRHDLDNASEESVLYQSSTFGHRSPLIAIWTKTRLTHWMIIQCLAISNKCIEWYLRGSAFVDGLQITVRTMPLSGVVLSKALPSNKIMHMNYYFQGQTWAFFFFSRGILHLAVQGDIGAAKSRKLHLTRGDQNTFCKSAPNVDGVADVRIDRLILQEWSPAACRLPRFHWDQVVRPGCTQSWLIVAPGGQSAMSSSGMTKQLRVRLRSASVFYSQMHMAATHYSASFGKFEHEFTENNFTTLNSPTSNFLWWLGVIMMGLSTFKQKCSTERATILNSGWEAFSLRVFRGLWGFYWKDSATLEES